MFDWDVINSDEFDIVEDKICKKIPQLEKKEEEINNKKNFFEKWTEFTKTNKLERKYYKKWRDFVEKKIEERQFLDIDSLEIEQESNIPNLEIELNEKIDIEKDNNKEEEKEQDEEEEQNEDEDTEKDSKKKKDYIVIEIQDEIMPKKRKRKIRKLNKRLRKKRKIEYTKIDGTYTKTQLTEGKNIFMMIKMDQWGQVHPEDLTNDIERKNVQKLFDFIWNEMQSSEKYAYVKYNTIDDKYYTAIENSILNTIGDWICNMWSNIENFFDGLICKRENSHTKKI